MLSMTMPTRPLSHPRASRGFVLIEALIAILIFSLGVLGLVGLQASLTRATTSAKFRADATYLAQTLIGQMWTDIPNLASYNNCASYTPCKNWYDTVTATLPAAETDIYYCSASDTTASCKDSGNVATPGRVIITIQWTVPGEGMHTFSTTSSVNP
jgi:type IV pilus assembly protein PilV